MFISNYPSTKEKPTVNITYMPDDSSDLSLGYIAMLLASSHRNVKVKSYYGIASNQKKFRLKMMLTTLRKPS